MQFSCAVALKMSSVSDIVTHRRRYVRSYCGCAELNSMSWFNAHPFNGPGKDYLDYRSSLIRTSPSSAYTSGQCADTGCRSKYTAWLYCCACALWDSSTGLVVTGRLRRTSHISQTCSPSHLDHVRPWHFCGCGRRIHI